MKIAVGIIIFNSDFVLRQVLESVYPHVNQILISEGTVTYWRDKGFTTSNDRTNEILQNFPDPDRKITIVHGTYAEKTEQANAYMKYVDPDTDYIWNLDADEVFKQDDIVSIKQILELEQPSTMGFRSYSFYGGFDRHLTGFEWDHNFIRIRKMYPGAVWANHRPPTIGVPAGITPIREKHLDHEYTSSRGIYMYHYSYVFPRQVKEKIGYYEAAVIRKDGCIPDYFNSVYRSWVLGTDQEREIIENRYKGVHEFTPETRGECYTSKFLGMHPAVILRDMQLLKDKFQRQAESLF